MNTKAISACILVMAMGIFSSCQKEYREAQQQQQKESKLLAGLSEQLSLNFPENVMPKTDFKIGVSTACGLLKVERAYVLAEDGVSKNYKGLSCNNIPEAVQFEQLGTVGNKEEIFTEKWEEYGTYLYRVTLDPKPNEGSQTCPTCPKESVSETVSNCFEVKVCRIETAFGGAKRGEGSAWWQIFDTEMVAKTGNLDWEQEISAAGNIVIGKVIYDGANLTVDLDEDWSLLQGETEPVKVAGFGVEPKSRIPSDNFKLYKGSDLTLNLSALKGNGLRYFAIHLDVQTANPEYF